MDRRPSEPQDRTSETTSTSSRRDVVKAAAYVAPVLLTLSVSPSFAQGASPAGPPNGPPDGPPDA